MLYKKNSQPKLTDELFKNPTCEYRGTPFWAWNCKLDSAEMQRQIEVFKEMGLGGFHMHVRTGLDTEYLSDEYMQVVKDCVRKAEKEDMLAWLYDEDRWPSGAAGGIVTKDVRYRQRHLCFTTEKLEGDNVMFVACYDVVLDNNGFLSSYKLIDEAADTKGKKWYAYRRLAKADDWYNGETYLDTLNKAAVERFIEVTHEAYKRELKADFGGVVPAIFTDEPQFSHKQVLNNSTDEHEVTLPWTDDIPQTYKKAYGADILKTLPELVWELPDGKISRARYLYHDHICERFADAFADTVGAWCEENGISLTGHMMEEPTLRSQTAALGETMRSYRGFQLPGIDMLCAWIELTTAKQAQSATHQFGREGVLSELYGVTGWDYDFRGYKLHGDWQAALGVTVRVPHLSWASMEGAAKRDYPASIHYQSPWYKEYPVVEDHFGRVNTALTRGKPVVKVAVVHPVESFWLHWGPNDKTAVRRESMDKRFLDVTDWLLKGSVDFDFISESLLPSLCKKGGNPLKVGKMKYDAVVVPSCETLRSTTLDRLEAFGKEGGKLIFMGDAPKYEDAKPSKRGKKLFDNSECISFDRAALLDALDGVRTVTIRNENGTLSDKFIYQLRKDNDCRWLFVSHCTEPYNKDVCQSEDLRITVNGEFVPYVYNTLNGEISRAACEYVNGNTVIPCELFDYDSLLLRLDRGRSPRAQARQQDFVGKVKVPSKVEFTLDEPNVLLLDMAETAVDGGEYLEREELLRADNIHRARLGMVERGGGCVQPWVIKKEDAQHSLNLRFKFKSKISYSGALLAIENPETALIVFNGKTVDNKVVGWYTDKAIKTVALPKITKGENVLEVTIPFGVRTNTEWCYILGDFGVEVKGKYATITEMPSKLAFSDVVHQGLAFYGGNITYHLKVNTNGGDIRVSLPHFRGAAVRAYLDGNDIGSMAFTPYATVAQADEGEHALDIVVFGNRFNSFGAVHNADAFKKWHGPDAWETEDSYWSYEYMLRPLGALSSPVIEECVPHENGTVAKKKIVVAGAGHGGLVAAAKLASAGHDVTVVEAASKRNLGHDWYDSCTLDAMEESGLAGRITEDDFTYMKRSCYYIASAVTPVHQPEREDGKYSTLIERRFLMKKLLEFASDNGVKFKFNTRVLSPVVEGDRVVGVETDKGKISADLVIDAAGVDSPVRSNLPEELGIEAVYSAGEVLYAYRGFFNREEGYENPITPHENFLYLHGIRGISWCATEDKHIDMLIGCFGPISQEYVDERLQSFRIRRPQLGRKLLRGGYISKIPTRRPLAQFVCNGYAAVGDSAYMTYPMSGSGIDMSLRAGAMLADTVLRDTEGRFTTKTLWAYNRDYIRKIGVKQASSDILKNILLSLEPEALDFLLEKRVITANDLSSHGSSSSASEMLGRVARGMRQLPVLIKVAGALSKGDGAEKLYAEIPDKYSKEAVDEWKTKVAQTIVPIEPNNPQ